MTLFKDTFLTRRLRKTEERESVRKIKKNYNLVIKEPDKHLRKKHKEKVREREGERNRMR